MPNEIIATPEARAAIARIRADVGNIIFHVTGGCCGCYLLDLRPGLTVGFSLEAAPGKRFALREITASNVTCRKGQAEAC